MEDAFDTTNINLEWLNNIYNEIKTIQDIERNAREGCRNLMEYLQIPLNSQRVTMADTQYKNMRFFALELDILVKNLAPVIKDKVDKYDKQLEPILKSVNNRTLFVDERRMNNKLVEIYTLPFFHSTVEFLVSIKAEIIKDIAHILYLPEEADNKKKW